MTKDGQSSSESEESGPDLTPQEGIPGKNGYGVAEKMTEYEKQRMKRIEENKARMKAMGLDKMASSLMGSISISQKKGKMKVGVEDDEEYKPSIEDDEEFSSASRTDEDDDDNDEFCVSRTKPKGKNSKNSTPSRKSVKLSANSEFVDEEDALMKAIALSLQDSDVNASNVKNPERKQIVRKDNTGKRKRKNSFASRVQMTEDELIVHFFQFDEMGKGGINVRDIRRVASSHDFTWKDEEMRHMIQFFDSDGDGKLSLDDFTKIVERCNMRQGSQNAERNLEA